MGQGHSSSQALKRTDHNCCLATHITVSSAPVPTNVPITPPRLSATQDIDHVLRIWADGDRIRDIVVIVVRSHRFEETYFVEAAAVFATLSTSEIRNLRQFESMIEASEPL